jgi:hypothetical protein
VFNVRSIRDQPIADAISSNITILPFHMAIACMESAIWIGKGNREERKKEK